MRIGCRPFGAFVIELDLSTFTGIRFADWPWYSHPVEGLLYAVGLAVALLGQVVAPIVELALVAIVGTVAVPIADTAVETTEVLGEKHKEQ
jgi:hypothetical protein